MKQKILILTTISGFLPQFEQNQIKLLQDMGIQVHYAANFQNPAYEYDEHYFVEHDIKTHHISIQKSPYKLRENFKALRELLRLIREEEIDGIHCHNPVGGVLGRLAGRLSRKTMPVVYTAHGFHFYKGAPLKNWLYYPVEMFLSWFTDCILTINEEDYRRAVKFGIKGGKKVTKLPGVGIDLKKYDTRPEKREDARRYLGVQREEICLMTSALLDKGKNYETVLKALAELKEIPYQYYICGEGPYREKLEKTVKELGIEKRVHFLGFQKQMDFLLQGADIFLFPSLREGLGMAALEAMACGVPVIAADNRGTREYMIHNRNGVVCGGKDVQAFADGLRLLSLNRPVREGMGRKAYEDVRRFGSKHTAETMEQVYKTLFAV